MKHTSTEYRMTAGILVGELNYTIKKAHDDDYIAPLIPTTCCCIEDKETKDGALVEVWLRVPDERVDAILAAIEAARETSDEQEEEGSESSDEAGSTGGGSPVE